MINKKLNHRAISSSQTLYNNSIKMNKIKTSNSKNYINYKQEKELDGCTFSPYTNINLNKNIKDPFKLRQKRWIESKELKELEFIKIKRNLELKNCTFKPKTNIPLNSISYKNFTDRSKKWSDFKKSKYIINKNSFKPKTANNYKKIVPNYLNKEKEEIIKLSMLISRNN